MMLVRDMFPSDASASVSIDAGVPGAPTGLTAMAAEDADGITLSYPGQHRWRPGALTLLLTTLRSLRTYDAADPVPQLGRNWT